MLRRCTIDVLVACWSLATREQSVAETCCKLLFSLAGTTIAGGRVPRDLPRTGEIIMKTDVRTSVALLLFSVSASAMAQGPLTPPQPDAQPPQPSAPPQAIPPPPPPPVQNTAPVPQNTAPVPQSVPPPAQQPVTTPPPA